ncbi:uncharacterized protein LOC105646268 [Jatropha curcas]|uniref:uncharacterized protein LOC105646268 n=1 Tax=Jatropha curcas TaxID=180498 RepID=UPI0009D75F5B|nr:uncharacterized protein LOC105646268 [Jatropha curcas]
MLSQQFSISLHTEYDMLPSFDIEEEKDEGEGPGNNINPMIKQAWSEVYKKKDEPKKEDNDNENYVDKDKLKLKKKKKIMWSEELNDV